MSSYLISIIRPKDYLHSEAFREIAETVQYGMRGIGHTAAIKENIVDPQVTNILLGAHLLGDGDLKAIPPGTIIFNLEQLGSQHLSESYYRLAENYQIWDYSSRNLERWLQQKCMHVPRLLEIGYVSELRRIVPSPDADIDVLFYGSVNEHRLHILRSCKMLACEFMQRSVCMGESGIR
jgi:hypothetical protein